nr:Ada metal-binding domain-containing protein [Roseomonas aerilata]
MTDEAAIWERAWADRDPAFDGAFFACVRTTGIYCRCVCPVRLPFRRNVDFAPSAAAAEAAGFRPCLRCRPEAAPFSPAWKGTLTTVERAFRLIVDDGALDGEGATVEGLAARLGMTERHLRRLFCRHLGATPTAIARTARVQRAKRLLTGTDLSMTEVALQAGFGSLRRFNAVFVEVYRRPPGSIRRKTPSHQAEPALVAEALTGSSLG